MIGYSGLVKWLIVSLVCLLYCYCCFFFFFQAEDGIRDIGVTGVQTCALPIFRQAVLEDDHAGHHVGLLDVRDVDALDAQRRVGELERLLQLRQRQRAGGEVAGPLDPVPGEGLLGVALHRLQQGTLVAPLRHPQAHAAATELAQQLLVPVGVVGQLGDGPLPGHRLARLADAGRLVDAAVDLQHRSEEHTSELQSRQYLVCRLLPEKTHNSLRSSLSLLSSHALPLLPTPLPPPPFPLLPRASSSRCRFPLCPPPFPPPPLSSLHSSP